MRRSFSRERFTLSRLSRRRLASSTAYTSPFSSDPRRRVAREIEQGLSGNNALWRQRSLSYPLRSLAASHWERIAHHRYRARHLNLQMFKSESVAAQRPLNLEPAPAAIKPVTDNKPKRRRRGKRRSTQQDLPMDEPLLVEPQPPNRGRGKRESA